MEKQRKEPAHNLIPILIAFINEKQKNSENALINGINHQVNMGISAACEVIIHEICEMTSKMIIPEQHLPDFITKLNAIHESSTSNVVMYSITNLISTIQKEKV